MRRSVPFAAALVLVGCSMLTPLGDLEGKGADAGADAVSEDSVVPDTGPPPPAPCDPNESVAANAIYVSSDGNDTSSGAASAPLATVAKGIVAAIQTNAKDVYVAEGAYPEALVLKETAAGLRVHGGWKRTGASWAKDCASGARDRTVIASPGNVGVRVQYAAIAGPAELETLTLATKPVGASNPDVAGESTYAVFLEANGSLTLTNVALAAGKGGSGGTSTAVPAATGTVACDGLTTCSSGAPVADGPAGPSATAGGTYAADGFHPSDGVPGGAGQNGKNGTIGPAGVTNGCVSICVGQCTSSDSCLNGATMTRSGGTGKCGCAGLGGGQGRAGHGGGASIGVWVGTGAKVSMSYAQIGAGGGGDGAAGSAGGGGAAGSAGGAGVGVSCPLQCGKSGVVGVNCTCIFTSTTTLTGGGAGGSGSKGANGGNGGGGSGGDAFGVVTFGSGQVLADPKTLTFVVGAAGAGAQGATSGARGDQLSK